MSDTALPRPGVPAGVALFARWTGLSLGAVLGILIAQSGRLGLGVLHALPVFGLCAVAGVLAGDVLASRPHGEVRRAGLTPRRVRDYLPVRFTALLTVQAAVLLVLLAVAAATASADDMGRAGRTLGAACGNVIQSHGPWPGLFYGAPVIGALALTTAACWYALHRIVRQPVPGGDSALRAADEQQRRDRALAVTAAWGLTVSAPLAGAALFASGALRSLSCLGAAAHAVGWALLPIALVAGGTAVWSLLTLAAPRSVSRRRS
ncbi:hypothetical protein Q5762_15390 [Streptomyces sp. P9(2023)]|uniref:hypothetical protein n=1 Tax=Streptomyces sp. P9(2023) TaxID=3064394 RepID=UPI0028F4219C|nr:hypothetical protein [Streptomyces sp. P9(2023)]MDT9689696.1 hypothetical protein [Streptomyces sp. P9(2023)]